MRLLYHNHYQWSSLGFVVWIHITTLLFFVSSSLTSQKVLALSSPPRQSQHQTREMPSKNNENQNNKQRIVMVTGANGYVASHIVKDLLSKGHVVHACVRDATNLDSVDHLQQLEGATEERLKFFSTGDLANANSTTKPFDVPMTGCTAVIHAATPLSSSNSKARNNNKNNGETHIYQPAMTSTKELLDCIGRHSSTVQCLVLTSSMSAVAPKPEPPIKDESCWSDPAEQKQQGNWYGCTKTFQESMCRDWYHDAVSKGMISSDFVYAAICPTMVLGPSLRRPSSSCNPKLDGVGGTMGTLQKWLQEGVGTSYSDSLSGKNDDSDGGNVKILPNDSMSFVHVEDCAKVHTSILNIMDHGQPQDRKITNEHHRYMCVVESLHWNDIMILLQELYSELPPYKAYDDGGRGGDGNDSPPTKVKPTQFSLQNLISLQIPLRSTKETLLDSIQYLKEIDAL